MEISLTSQFFFMMGIFLHHLYYSFCHKNVIYLHFKVPQFHVFIIGCQAECGLLQRWLTCFGSFTACDASSSIVMDWVCHLCHHFDYCLCSLNGYFCNCQCPSHFCHFLVSQSHCLGETSFYFLPFTSDPMWCFCLSENNINDTLNMSLLHDICN